MCARKKIEKQNIGAVIRNEREPKNRLVRGTSKIGKREWWKCTSSNTIWL